MMSTAIIAGVVIADRDDAVAQSAAQASFNVPAGPLNRALTTFGRQAGLQVTYLTSIGAGKTTAGVSGPATREQALARILQGTGLSYQFTNATTVAISQQTASGGTGGLPAGAISLDTIDVQGASSSDPGRTEGTGSYTPSVTASATRLQLTPRETPQSLSVVTRQQIEDFSLRSVNEVVNHTPGLSTIDTGGERIYFYSRGFKVRNYQYDGMPGSYRGNNPMTETGTDMAMYDRVEVLKGATGLLTGPGDPGATINLIRKKPTKTFQGHTTLSTGSWDDYRGELDLSGPLNESGTVRGRFVTAHQDRKSYLDHFHYKGSLFYGIVETDLTPDTLLTVGANYQSIIPKGTGNGMIPLFNSFGEFNEMPRSFNPAARWSSWDQQAYNVFTTLEHRFENDWRVKLHFNRQISSYDAPVATAADGNPNPLNGKGVSMWMGKWTSESEYNAANLYATGPFWLFGRKHELVLGGGVSRHNQSRLNFIADPATPGSDTAVSDFYNWIGDVPQPRWIPMSPNPYKETYDESAFYSATRLQVHDRLKVLLGARVSNYEHRGSLDGAYEDSKISGKVTPYYGAVFDITDVLSAYASYTGIFRPQAAYNEQGATLPPLEGTNTEFGLKAAFFNGRLNASAAYFQVNQDNYALATGGRTPYGTEAYRPVDGVITKGFELELSGQLSPQWQIQAGFTHNVSQKDGARLFTLTPDNQFKLYTTYKLDGPLDGLTVGGGVRWIDKIPDQLQFPQWSRNYRTFAAPSYWLVDLMASYKFDDKLSATLNVRNLFDKKYYSFYTWYSGYAWGAPRSVNLSMTYKF